MVRSHGECKTRRHHQRAYRHLAGFAPGPLFLEDEMNLRKLDALVATHIMDLGPTEEKVWRGRKDYYLKSDTAFVAVPMYTRTIGAAWDVVEKLRDDDFSLEENGTHWKVSFGVHWAGSISVTQAICIAALRAKGIDVSEWEK